jgi:uncharacterized membrane protein YhhN
MKKIFFWIFILVSIAELISQAMDLQGLHTVTKPLLMTVLIAYYITSVKKEERSGIVVLALAFSWLGDVLLMFQAKSELFFIGGLLAFLVAHLYYIFTYRQFMLEDTSKALLGVQRFRYSFPIILAGTGLITVLYSHLGGLKIPVIIYALVLVLMVINALFRFGRTSLASFTMVFFGATLFMMSDSMIAINKFLMPIAYSGFWIMLTYLTAQYLIIEGLLKHRNR